MNMSTLKVMTIFFVFALIGCNNVNDDTSNTVFEKFSPTTREYKNELAAKLKTNPEEIHYTFNKFVINDGKEYIDVQIIGPDFEGTGLVLVNNWSKLESIKQTKGKGYSGAELRGLKLDIEEDSSGANLIYNDLDKIVD